jgi:hypothetical protein
MRIAEQMVFGSKPACAKVRISDGNGVIVLRTLLHCRHCVIF